MNTRQRQTIERVTSRLDRSHHDGSITYSVEAVSADTIMLAASNANDDLRWFHRHLFLLAIIGPRGGLTIRQKENVNGL